MKLRAASERIKAVSSLVTWQTFSSIFNEVSCKYAFLQPLYTLSGVLNNQVIEECYDDPLHELTLWMAM